MRLHSLLALALMTAACGGGDEAPPPPPPQPGGGGGKPPPKKQDPKGSPLQPRVQIEQRVDCPAPEKPTGPDCKPEAASCDPGLYCIGVGDNKFKCEPCPERESIRHEFKDRDFVADQVRDPFQSFVIVQPELAEETEKKQEGPCNRPEQFVATNYSYLELRLVGIVAQGTSRKVLMMDRGNLGHIIRRGDCVGKEKAVVKDIGSGYVTFVIAPDPEDKNPNKVPEERSVLLHPKGLQVAPQPTLDGATTTTAPIVAPPGGAGGSATPITPKVPTLPAPGTSQ
jgi:Tfp pilus assembly protein PilP